MICHDASYQVEIMRLLVSWLPKMLAGFVLGTQFSTEGEAAHALSSAV